MKTNTKVRPSESGARRDAVLCLNQNTVALCEAADAFEGAAEEAGITSEEELSDLVREARAEIWAERHSHLD